jgi:hypothetical protein
MPVSISPLHPVFAGEVTGIDCRKPLSPEEVTPTSASWPNAVKNFFSKMTRQRIRRGVFRSIIDLQAAIDDYLAEHNASPKPFVWTKSAAAILAKLDRCPVSPV